MTNKKIIEELRAIADYFIEQSGGSVPICLEAAIKIISNLPDWIPVSERLPEKNGSYLIQVDSSDGTATITFMMVDQFNKDGTWLHCDNKRRKVVAWMPLPESFKKEGEK